MEKLATDLSKLFDTELEEMYYEEDVSWDDEISDAGFDLKNGISLQYAPYMQKPYIMSFFKTDTNIHLFSGYNAEEVLEYFSKNKKEIENKII